MSFRGVKRRGNPLNRNATQWRLPLTALVLAITTAQKIFAISSSRDKNSCHNFARLSAWLSAPLAQADKRKLIQGILIHGMCIFRVRAATAASKRTPSIAQTALRLWQPPQMSFRGAKRRGNPLNRNATQWRLPLTALVLAITTAQKIFAISSSRGKDSCRSFARLSAWLSAPLAQAEYSTIQTMFGYHRTKCDITVQSTILILPPQAI